MLVQEVCRRHVVTLSGEASIVTAAKLMREEHVGDVVVVDRQEGMRVPTGILTDRDLVVGVLAQGISDFDHIKVADVMGSKLVTAHESDAVFDVLKTMWREGVRRIPVVSLGGALVGIVAYDDLIHVLAEQIAVLTRIAGRQQERERNLRQ